MSLRNPLSFSLATLALAASLAVVAAPSAPAADEAPAATLDLENATCPVKGTPAKPAIYETYKGMKVHFCCTNCAAKFRVDPETYVPVLRADPAVAKKMDAAAAATASGASSAPSAPSIDRAVDGWPMPARVAAAKLAAKYGAPKATEAARISWETSGPWKRTVVHHEGEAVEQTVAHRLEPAKASALAAFHHVKVDAQAGEVTVRHEREELNFVAVNLAHDIVEGTKTVDQANARFEELAKMVKEGKTPPESQRLVFQAKAAAGTK